MPSTLAVSGGKQPRAGYVIDLRLACFRQAEKTITFPPPTDPDKSEADGEIALQLCPDLLTKPTTLAALPDKRPATSTFWPCRPGAPRKTIFLDAGLPLDPRPLYYGSLYVRNVGLRTGGISFSITDRSLSRTLPPSHAHPPS